MPAAERAKRMAAGEPYALRLDMAAATVARRRPGLDEEGAGPQGETGTVAAAPQAWGDVILARKETPTSYHLSVTVDDALQGVTHVVRGADLFWSTSVHRLLQALLGLPAPRYRHHRLVMGPDGRKLSKATRATALRELRAQGASAARHPDDDRPCARRALTFRLRLRAMVADGTDHDTQDRDTGTQRGRKSARKPTRVRHGERFHRACARRARA